MWYEILPAFAITSALVFIPHPWMYIYNRLRFNGHPEHRYWDKSDHHYHAFHRDYRLTGNEFVLAGLDKLPVHNPDAAGKSTEV